MAERQLIFMEVAEAFGTPLTECDFWQRHISWEGICRALKEHQRTEHGRSLPTVGTLWWLFNSRCWPENHKSYFSYWLPYRSNRRDDVERWRGIRSLFCCLMAAMTDKEFAELMEK